MKTIYKASFFLLVMLWAPISLSLAQADPLILNIPQQYGTIQSAINAAATGDIILVVDGTYNMRDITISNKAVAIITLFRQVERTII